LAALLVDRIQLYEDAVLPKPPLSRILIRLDIVTIDFVNELLGLEVVLLGEFFPGESPFLQLHSGSFDLRQLLLLDLAALIVFIIDVNALLEPEERRALIVLGLQV